jgi:hypothetical protein
MKLQTPVNDSPCKVGISYQDKIMMIGSCFTDNIGSQLKDFGFDVCINPFGTLYNPASVHAAMKRLVSREAFTAGDCVRIGAGDLRFCSFSHHTSFARESETEFLENANSALETAADFFRDCNKVIITLGTSWCYRHIERDMIVSNCLKHPAAEYSREFLQTSKTADILRDIMEICSRSETPKEVIFTVSPIRHFKDGAHGNQISKASLLVSIDQTLNELEHAKADYFPSYEIMMDELRDYRFYAEDMCHPTLQAVNYIRERFLAWALPSGEHQTLEENIKIFKRASHRS